MGEIYELAMKIMQLLSGDYTRLVYSLLDGEFGSQRVSE